MCNDSATLSSQNNELLHASWQKNCCSNSPLLGSPRLSYDPSTKELLLALGQGGGAPGQCSLMGMRMPYQPSNILITALAFYHGFLSSSLCMCPTVTISPHREKTISYSSLWPTQFLYCD